MNGFNRSWNGSKSNGESERMVISMSDLISRQDALKPFCIAPDGTRIPELDCDNFPVEFSVEFIKKHLLSLPSAEPKCGGDLISRQAAVSIFMQRAKELAGFKGDIGGACEGAAKLIKSLPSADAVQIPIKLEKRYPQSRDEDITDAFMRGYLAGRSSADRPTGEWVEVEVLPEVYDIEGVKTWGSKVQCDQCGFIFTAIEGHITQYNFCPNCGARMLREDGEHEPI